MTSANFMGMEPNFTPCLKDSMPVCSIVLDHLCRSKEASNASRSSTKSGKQNMKALEAITKKIMLNHKEWYVSNIEYGAR